MKGFSDPHLGWLEKKKKKKKNFASSGSNYRIIGPHSAPFCALRISVGVPGLPFFSRSEMVSKMEGDL